MSEQVRTSDKPASSEIKLLNSAPVNNDREGHERKKKASYSERSRSHSERSRSKEGKKHKHKQKHKKKRSRSRQIHTHHRSKEHRRNQYQGRDDRNRRGRQDYNDRPREKYANKDYNNKYREKPKQEPKLLPTEIPMPIPTEIPMPIPNEIAMPPIQGERRKRERSRSPLNYYRRNQNNNDGEFWDSYCWVPRMNYLPTVTNSALTNTKKMRRLMITSIPFEIGITEDDLRNLITRFMAQNYLKDEMNSCPVLNLEINEEEKNVAVELSSVEETCRICKLQKIQLFKGTVNGIIRLGDSIYGNNVVTQAQTAAQAQAAAFAAINVLQNKRTTFSVENLRNTTNLTSTLIRVTNAVTPYMAGQLNAEQWTQYEQDLLEGFSQFGTIVHHWFVKKDEKDICADAGNLFIEYESKREAEKAMDEMEGRMYDERSVHIFYVPRELYYQNYKKNLTPPVIKEKK